MKGHLQIAELTPTWNMPNKDVKEIEIGEKLYGSIQCVETNVADLFYNFIDKHSLRSCPLRKLFNQN